MPAFSNPNSNHSSSSLSTPSFYELRELCFEVLGPALADHQAYPPLPPTEFYFYGDLLEFVRLYRALYRAGCFYLAGDRVVIRNYYFDQFGVRQDLTSVHQEILDLIASTSPINYPASQAYSRSQSQVSSGFATSSFTHPPQIYASQQGPLAPPQIPHLASSVYSSSGSVSSSYTFNPSQQQAQDQFEAPLSPRVQDQALQSSLTPPILQAPQDIARYQIPQRRQSSQDPQCSQLIDSSSPYISSLDRLDTQVPQDPPSFMSAEHRRELREYIHMSIGVWSDAVHRNDRSWRSRARRRRR